MAGGGQNAGSGKRHCRGHVRHIGAPALIAIALIFVVSNSANAERLNIRPVYQQTPVWCWAAVAEMVFRHFRVANLNPAGNFQCGIVGGIGGICAANCMACPVPAGQLRNMETVIERYPEFARRMTGHGPELTAYGSHAELEVDEIIDEIDAGRPVIAGISPSGMRYPGGMAEHVALIIGYEAEGQMLIVNDPFPFDEVGAPNPYVRAGGRRLQRGQYLIRYSDFVGYLSWENTIQVSD